MGALDCWNYCMDRHALAGLVAALSGLIFAASAVGQSFPPAEVVPANDPAAGVSRPRIGLALSGGGARGGAHIGVLRALAEQRIPIDYIAGTSMGAVMGGLYASGLDEAEMETVATDIDWEWVFTEDPPRDYRSFRRKRDDDLFLVKQRAGFNRGELELPLGLIQGQNIDLFLDRTLLPVSQVDDFDELAIPFRAVAAEIASGETVVLSEGSLSRSLRASLSIPTIFAPIRIDDRLLVDGGIAQNLPVETVRAMGADVVIAIDISTPLGGEDELTSLLSVTGQLTSLLIVRQTQAQIELLGDEDVLITPDLGEIGTSDFTQIADTFPFGYESTMAAADMLRPLALSPEAYAAHRATRLDPRQEGLPVIDFVRLNNDSGLGDNLINERLKNVPTGVPLDVDALEYAIAELYGLDLFQNVRYEVVEENGATGLEVGVEERLWGPGYLQGGVQYSSAGDDDTRFGLSVSYLRTQMNERGAEWRTTFAVGDEPKLYTEWHQPLGFNARAFLAADYTHEAKLVNLYSGGSPIATVQPTEDSISVSAGREFGNWGEVRLGLVRGNGETDLVTGSPLIPLAEEFDRGQFFTRFTLDTLDSFYFPSSGTFVLTEWRGSRDDLGAEDNFDQFVSRIVASKSFGKNILTGALRYDTPSADVAPPRDLFRIGGFWDLSGYAENELSGQHVARLTGAYYRKIRSIRQYAAYVGISYETGNAWASRGEISMNSAIDSASIWLGGDTLIGPIYLAYGKAEDGRNGIYFFIGSVF
jgi:NTE family protein